MSSILKMKTKFLSILLIISYSVFAQNGQIKYSPSFKFKDGIFENFQQVKNNAPIPKLQIVTDIDYNSFDFFERLLEQETITYYDNLGVSKEIKTKNIWGFSDKGILYININGTFNRIPVFGKISHFIADKTVVDYDPYYNTGMYNNYYGPQPYTTKTVLIQYLLDFKTGKIYEFNYQAVEKLISDDIDLYEEFSKLSKRKKKKLKFLYIRKYNKKHPIYFPKK